MKIEEGDSRGIGLASQKRNPGLFRYKNRIVTRIQGWLVQPTALGPPTPYLASKKPSRLRGNGALLPPGSTRLVAPFPILFLTVLSNISLSHLSYISLYLNRNFSSNKVFLYFISIQWIYIRSNFKISISLSRCIRSKCALNNHYRPFINSKIFIRIDYAFD